MLGNQAFLGVTLQEQDGQVAIESVVDDGPAASAGLQAGDIITALNDEEVTSVDDVISIVSAKSPGDALTVEVERNGETQSFDVELGTRPGDRGLSNIFIGGDEVEFNEEDSSWEVIKVQEGSILSEAGLMAGDVITAIDGEAFTPDQMPQMLQPIDPNATAALTVQRGDETLELEAPSTIRIALMLASDGMMFERGNGPFEFTIPPMRGNPPLGLRFDRPVRLGVAFVNLNETTAAEYETDVTEGALITEILADSPAEAAGLMVGDVISAVDGDVVDEERTLADRMVAYEAGDTITLDVLRDGETIQVDVTLEEVVMTPPQIPEEEATAEPDI
jgi:S1-C subfamily serine protease